MMPIARILQIAHTDKKGTNVLALTVAAEKLGFAAKGVKSMNADGTKNLEPLKKIPLSAIAHIVIKEQLLHYVVIYKVEKNHIKAMDPGSGKLEKWTIEDFTKKCLLSLL